MKKIYYLLCLLPLMPLVSSCDDEEAEVELQLTDIRQRSKIS